MDKLYFRRPSTPFTLAAVLFGMLLAGNAFFPDASQYRGLAESFLHGKLYFLSTPEGWGDTAFFQGHHYWPLGILPAILIAPFIWIGFYDQGALSFISVVGVFCLCFRLAQRMGYSREDACWLTLAFCFATSFLGVAAVPLSWSYAHVVAVLFLFLAIQEYEGSRRFPIIGLFIALAMASRPPTAFNSLFFAGTILFSTATIKDKIKSLTEFAAPIAAIGMMIAWYNFARFGNPLETGYSYQLNYDGTMLYAGAPLFSLSNIPAHLADFIVGLPHKDATGTSVFLASPFLIFLFMPARRWQMLDYALALNIFALLLITLAFSSAGGPRQIGYRFSLDYLPFVFWLLMRRRAELGAGFKSLIVLAVVIDLCLLIYAATMRFV